MAAFADAATRLACSTVLAGTARDSLKQFFVTLQAAAPAQAEALQQPLLQAGAAAPRPAQRGAAECVAAMCKSSPDAVAKTLRACVATMQQPETVRACSLAAAPCHGSTRPDAMQQVAQHAAEQQKRLQRLDEAPTTPKTSSPAYRRRRRSA